MEKDEVYEESPEHKKSAFQTFNYSKEKKEKSKSSNHSPELIVKKNNFIEMFSLKLEIQKQESNDILE